jgi:hypothetical protein
MNVFFLGMICRRISYLCRCCKMRFVGQVFGTEHCFSPEKNRNGPRVYSNYVILMIGPNCLVVSRQSKSHNATTIYTILGTRFHEKAAICSSIPNRPRRLHFAEDIFEPGIHLRKPSDRSVDFRILTELAVSTFCGVRTLASTLTQFSL